MYKILHIPSSEFLINLPESSHFKYSTYESPSKKDAKFELSIFLKNWRESDLVTKEQYEIYKTGGCWSDIAAKIEYSKAEFDIVKVS